MSGTIHVNTDQLRRLGTHFTACNEYLREQLIPDIQRMTMQTEGQWSGTSRQHYDELFHQWTVNAQNLLHAGMDISNHISQTAEHFDQANHSR